jgi:hypothetical protein
VKSFNFWNRIRRELALVPYALMRGIPAVYSPFLDHDVYDFLMALAPTVMSPGLASKDKSFHADSIHRASPQHAHVPFEDPMAPKTDATAHYGRFGSAVARYLFTKHHVEPRLLNRGYVWPRLGFGLLRPGYRQSHPWLSSLALYLFQLDAAAAGLAGAASLEPSSSAIAPVPDVIAIAPAPPRTRQRGRSPAHA